MKRFRYLLVLLLWALFQAGAVHARAPVPLVELENEPIEAVAGGTPTLENVRIALARGAATKGWTIADVGPGEATGTLVVRNKHTVQVAITYTEKSISIKYKDSSNMKFGQDSEGQRVIHPFYMKWVRNLVDAVKVELARL